MVSEEPKARFPNQKFAKHYVCCLPLQQKPCFLVLPDYKPRGIYEFPHKFGKEMLWCVLGHVNPGRFRLLMMASPILCAAAE